MAKNDKKLLDNIKEHALEYLILHCVVAQIGQHVLVPIGRWVLAQIDHYLLTPIWLWLSCLLRYSTNMEELRSRLEILRNKRDKLQKGVDEGSGEVALPRIQEWLSSASKITEDVTNLLDNTLQLDLRLLYQRSKCAKEKIAVVNRLIESCGFTGIVATFGSRIHFLKEINEALVGGSNNIIGISGVSGVGKTFLVGQVIKEAEYRNQFEGVGMVKVSSPLNLERIQCEIADMIGLKFDEGSDTGRRLILLQKLAKMRVLIILDDIQQKIDLEAIGIPHGEGYSNCKIVLVSQSQDLCDQSGSEKDFPIGALSEDEGWKLFQNTGGKYEDQSDSPALVAERYAGLPGKILQASKARKKISQTKVNVSGQAIAIPHVKDSTCLVNSTDCI